jgi:hypothetical protein
MLRAGTGDTVYAEPSKLTPYPSALRADGEEIAALLD